MLVIYDGKDRGVDPVIEAAICLNAEVGSVVTIHVSRADIRRTKGRILKNARTVPPGITRFIHEKSVNATKRARSTLSRTCSIA